jgi:hypothetical protein
LNQPAAPEREVVTMSDQPKSPAALVWAAGGAAAGGILVVKYKQYAGVAPDAGMTPGQALLYVALIIGPACAFATVGERLVLEVEKRESTWATFWTTTVGVFVPVFALLGVTDIDDLASLLG